MDNQLAGGKRIWLGIIRLGVLVAAGIYLWKVRDPLGGKGPDLMAYLTEEKTICENRAQALQAKGIDGKVEYEKVQAAASACIGHLQGVVDQGGGDKQAISDRIARLQSASVAFRGWADNQLGPGGGVGEEGGSDPLAAAIEF